MLIVISPAKSLDFETSVGIQDYTIPDFLPQSEELIKELKKLSIDDISQFMAISPKLAQLNFERIQTWHPNFNSENAKQALLAFSGDVYTGIDASSFNSEDFAFAQKNLRILSGLYGVLRPMDLIQPYRLEMGKKLETPKGKDLYQFWGNQITDVINQTINSENHKDLINLASNEYFKSIQKKQIQAKIITPIFKDYKNGAYKVVSFYAKKARGLMSRFIIQNQLTNCEDLKAFNLDGYHFNPNLTKGKDWIFTREH
ncbi:MAG: peroxide stress protein YaaA [Marinifilaceae bacterium]